MARRVVIFTLLGLALLSGAVVVGWRINLQERSRYTDARTIDTPVATAPVRQILWQPAETVPGAAGASADQYEPRVSADGSVLVFVQGRAGENADLYQRTRTVDGWSAPEAVPGINTPSDELGPELSRDGRTLYFYSNRAGSIGGYDLWVSQRGDDGWKEPVNLGAAVNTEFNEYGPALTPDNTRLYFSSNRPRPGEERVQRDPWPATIREQRTRHDYDLYSSEVLASGLADASPVLELNTIHDEGAPAVSPAGDFLYFASDRPRSIGGFDVFRARILRGQIQAAQNLGPAINTAANDLDPSLSTDGFRIYFSSDRATQPSAARAESTEATTPQVADEPARYALYSSASREVFIETDPLQAGNLLMRLWGAAWPWLLALLAAAVLATLFYLAMRDAAMRQRLAQLSLMAKCLLISLLIHAALLSAFAAWRVGTAIGDMLRDGGDGNGTQVTLGASAGEGSLESQVRGTFTTVGIEAPTLDSSRPEPTLLDIQAPTIQLASTPANLTLTRAPVSISLDDAPSPAASPTPEPTPPIFADATPSIRTPTAEPAAPPTVEGRSDLQPEIAPVPARSTTVQIAGMTMDRISLAPAAADVEVPSSIPGESQSEAPTTMNAAAPSPAAMRSTLPTVSAQSATEARLPGTSTQAAIVEPASGAAITASSQLPTTPQPAISGSTESTRISIAPSITPIPQLPSGALSAEATEASTTPASTPRSSTSAPAVPAISSNAVNARLPGASPTPTITAREESTVGGSGTDAPVAALPTANRPALGLAPSHAVAPIHLSPAPSASGSGHPGVATSNPFEAAEAPAGASRASAPAKGQTNLQGLPSIALRSTLPAIPADIPSAPAAKPESFAQRAPEIREEVLKKTGGSPETERAVAAALDWFSRHQSADGRWSGQHFDRQCQHCSSPAEIESDAAMTGMALLCFLGAGHTHQADGPHRESVRKALKWIVDRTDPSGDLRRGETMYSQTIAAVALCEAFAMTSDPWLESPARRAVTFVARGASRGSTSASDTSVLGWQIMAIKSAQRAGFDVPTTAFDAARRWLDQTATRNAPGRYAYAPSETPSPAATAEAMFVQQLLGRTRDEPRMRQSADFILTAPPTWRREAPTHYWYYATLALFQQQGDHWKQWNEAIARELLKNQRQDGPAKGSWDPQDPWSRLGGRVYQTAVCTLSLEVYYRYRLAEPGAAR